VLIEELVKEGLLLVRGDQNHDLRVGFRCKLLSSLDEVHAGQIRRAKLAVLAIEKVLPFWGSILPTDDTPRQALTHVEELLAGNITSKTMEGEMGRLWTHCDDLS
jgi:Immunity protein Imm5